MHERSESEVFITKEVVRSWKALSESHRHTRPKLQQVEATPWPWALWHNIVC